MHRCHIEQVAHVAWLPLTCVPMPCVDGRLQTTFSSEDDVEDYARKKLRLAADFTTVAQSHMAMIEFHLRHRIKQLVDEIDTLKQQKADLQEQVANLTEEVAAQETGT